MTEHNNKERRLRKTRIHIPFRYVFAMLITLYEVAAILAIVILLSINVPYFYVLCVLTQVGCIVKIASSDDNPDYKIPWLLLVVIVPVAGFMFYFIFYSRQFKPKYVKRLNSLENNVYQRDDRDLFEQLRIADPVAKAQAKMLCTLADSHLFTDTI